jgi:hypothetical protein
MGHDVAPMAGGIADREKDRLVGPPGFGKGFRSPGTPMDGIATVLEQIGTGGVAQQIFGHDGLSGERSAWPI